MAVSRQLLRPCGSFRNGSKSLQRTLIHQSDNHSTSPSMQKTSRETYPKNVQYTSMFFQINCAYIGKTNQPNKTSTINQPSINQTNINNQPTINQPPNQPSTQTNIHHQPTTTQPTKQTSTNHWLVHNNHQPTNQKPAPLPSCRRRGEATDFSDGVKAAARVEGDAWVEQRWVLY